MTCAAPYRSTPWFDAESLPVALRARHTTKAGVWGVVRLTEGRLRLSFLDPAEELILDPETPGVIAPGRPHFVTPLGAMTMRVDFYDAPPAL